jgi:hypothetical protein
LDESQIPLVEAGNVLTTLIEDSTIAVRWITESDPSYYDIYNRPFADILIRQLVLSKSLDNLSDKLGFKVQHPFLNQPRVLVNTTSVDLPGSWFHDMLIGLNDSFNNIKLVSIQRLPTSGDQDTGVMRLVFAGDVVATGLTAGGPIGSEAGLFYADYEIDSSLTYQIVSIEPVTLSEHPNPTISRLSGFIFFKTLDTVEYEDFFNILEADQVSVNEYEIEDFLIGEEGDFDEFDVDHGTGLLTVSSYLPVPVISDSQIASGNVNMNSGKIINLGNPISNDDALNKLFADTRYLNISFSTMSNILSMGNNQIKSLSNSPALSGDIINEAYADDVYLNIIGDLMFDNIDMNTFGLLNVSDPSSGTSLINRDYADNRYVELSGDSLDSTADLNFSGGGEIVGLPSVPSATAAASKEYVDNELAGKYVSKSGSTMDLDADLNLNGGEILGLPTNPSLGAAASSDFVDFEFVTGVSPKVPKAGGTMDSGDSIFFDGGEVLGLPATPADNDAAASKEYVNNQDQQLVRAGGSSMDSGADLTFSGGGEITGLPATPLSDGSATSKSYVDLSINNPLDVKSTRTKYRIITSNETYEPPEWVNLLYVIASGGGGGGAGGTDGDTTSGYGGGGGGGGSSGVTKTAFIYNPDSSYSITIGSGGTGGTAGNPGGTGGSTSAFGLTCEGGDRGEVSTGYLGGVGGSILENANDGGNGGDGGDQSTAPGGAGSGGGFFINSFNDVSPGSGGNAGTSFGSGGGGGGGGSAIFPCDFLYGIYGVSLDNLIDVEGGDGGTGGNASGDGSNGSTPSGYSGGGGGGGGGGQVTTGTGGTGGAGAGGIVVVVEIY